MAMDTAAGAQPPSMAELVRAISEEAAAPVVPAPQVVQLPRPRLFGRLLVLAAVGLIIAMAALLVLLTRHVQGLMSDIRTREELLANPPLPPLPADERLLDGTTFAIELAAQPAQHARLHAARAHALLGVGRATEAIEGFAIAATVSDAPLAPVDRVALGEALFATGEVDAARATLLTIEPGHLGVADQARCNDLLVRLTMAGLQAERQQMRSVVRP